MCAKTKRNTGGCSGFPWKQQTSLYSNLFFFLSLLYRSVLLQLLRHRCSVFFFFVSHLCLQLIAGGTHLIQVRRSRGDRNVRKTSRKAAWRWTPLSCCTLLPGVSKFYPYPFNYRGICSCSGLRICFVFLKGES